MWTLAHTAKWYRGRWLRFSDHLCWGTWSPDPIHLHPISVTQKFRSPLPTFCPSPTSYLPQWVPCAPAVMQEDSNFPAGAPATSWSVPCKSAFRNGHEVVVSSRKQVSLSAGPDSIALLVHFNKIIKLTCKGVIEESAPYICHVYHHQRAVWESLAQFCPSCERCHLRKEISTLLPGVATNYQRW